jgi:hypothetical protein
MAWRPREEFLVLSRERQLAQQRGTGAVGVLAFESFNQFGRGGWDSSRLPAVLPGFGDQSWKPVLAIATRPLQHGFLAHRAAAGMRMSYCWLHYLHRIGGQQHLIVKRPSV